MKYAYKEKRLSPENSLLVEAIVLILEDYMRQGFVMTVRQVYYQLVAKDFIPNTLKSYKHIADLVSDARMAGLLDWDGIEDRTREFVKRSAWANGREILHSAAAGFHMNLWEGQSARVFAIIEKEALVGVVQAVCTAYDVPLLAARGYPSMSIMREFCDSMLRPAAGDDLVIIHMGDHDPSGLGMTGDLEKRIAVFAEGEYDVDVRRIALNFEQTQALKLPENPAKATDPRFKEYKRQFGIKSWELDALTPKFLNNILEKEIKNYIDEDTWEARLDEIHEVKKKILKVAERF